MIKFTLVFSLIATTLLVNSLKLNEVVNILSESSHFKAAYEKNLNNLIKQDASYINFTHRVTFDCDLSYNDNRTEVTVHTLRPSDIKLVGAIGDSLTAALGARATLLPEMLTEYRGVSWSAGGDNDLEKTLTMPNIIKKYSPGLTGFSLGEAPLYSKGKELNRAVSGARAMDLMSQAVSLIEMLKSSEYAGLWNEWKVVTLFIGANDLCQCCLPEQGHLPLQYISYIRDVLDLFHKQVPKMFINLVSILNITDLKDMNKGETCSLLHKYVECDCGAFPANETAEKDLLEYFHNYTRLTKELVDSARYDTTNDFTVVLQPFLKGFKAPRTSDGQVDMTYFAPDCFHFSAKTHALTALTLWNNMLQPVGQKQTIINMNSKILCPSKNQPYFFTNKNSN